MNLISELPRTLLINNLVYEINTDFRRGIEFEGLFKKNLEDEEFWNEALKIYYPILDMDIMNNDFANIKLYENITSNINEAIKKMLWFYKCGKEEEKEENKSNSNKEEILSYEYDADYIFSAFLDQYGVNIKKIEYLHWWEFKAMIKGFKDDNKISEIMSIRAMDTKDLKGKELEHYKKLKKIYAIPKDKKEVNRSKSIAEILKRGGDLSELEE